MPDLPAQPKQPDLDPIKGLADSIRRTQAQIDDLSSQVAQSERSELMSILAAAVAHEVRNILTPVQSSAEFALANLDDAALVKRSLQRITRGAERAVLVTDAILRCAAGARCSTWNTSPSACVVEEAAERAVEFAGGGGDGISIEVSVERGCRAAMDQVCLEQVILNLILNAQAAMGGRRGKIAVRGCSTWNSELGPRVLIEVEDEGCGVEPERLESIFGAFESDGGKGKGLGLTICRHLIEAAGGTLVVRSEISVGTSFMMELPAVVGEGAAERGAA